MLDPRGTGDRGSHDGARENGHSNGNSNGGARHNGLHDTQLRPAARIVPHEEPIGTAVVGYGYWGPNLARNVAECSQLRLEALCDSDPAQLHLFRRRHPGARAVRELDALLVDPAIEAIVIATPPQTHAALATRALRAGKHVLVEKPL